MSHQSETLTGKIETTWGKTTVGLGGVFAALVAIAAWFGIVATVFQEALLRRIGASMPATLLLGVGVATDGGTSERPYAVCYQLDAGCRLAEHVRNAAG
jgi:predicted anti-sigma-YlaC factor YlaD